MSVGKKRECKSPLFFIFKKNIKFLILGIDNIGAIVYSIIKIRDKEKPKMTRTYKIAREIANEIVKVKNAKYEALKERDFESYGKFDELEDNLFDCIKSFGYEASLEYENSPMLFCEGEIAFKVAGISISEIKEEN